MDAGLIEAARGGTLIPFIGAGFSSAAGFPGWLDLLEQVHERIDDSPVTFASITESCGHDPLRVAEYLYLLVGETMGPIRHRMEGLLGTPGNLLSSAHVELANLNLPVIYTTNFDELIEDTYRVLGTPCSITTTVRDLTLERADRARIVKFHGDLQHDESLVLTEKSFLDRLDFSSPLDVRFRSDLLGKSVVFLGYGFGDINVRVLWHRLGALMGAVPAEDRPPSFIVRMDGDAVLERLDRAVGLTTITLDPLRMPKTREDKTELLERFMLELSLAVSWPSELDSQPSHGVCSPRLINEARAILQRTEVQPLNSLETRILEAVGVRRLLPRLRPEAEGLLGDFANAVLYGEASDYRETFALSFSATFADQVGGRQDHGEP
jgi:hypothetical protein